MAGLHPWCCDAAVFGIFEFADTGSAKPDIMARGYELNAIAAISHRGCSLQGGIGPFPVRFSLPVFANSY